MAPQQVVQTALTALAAAHSNYAVLQGRGVGSSCVVAGEQAADTGLAVA
jgi:hypothetical protein